MDFRNFFRISFEFFYTIIYSVDCKVKIIFGGAFPSSIGDKNYGDDVLFEIYFLFETNAKCAEFETIKAELLYQLHQKLKNSYITIQSKIGNFESKNYVQTKEEMYRKMVQKNPLIEELRKNLDLDFY